MGISIANCRKIFDLVCNGTCKSRTEISSLIKISQVAVGNAVELLINNKLLSFAKKCRNPNKAEKGRNAQLITINQNRYFLFIDLSSNAFSYTISPLCDKLRERRFFPYINSLDFCDNITVLISAITNSFEYKSLKPDYIALAVPDDLLSNNRKSNFISDYSGENFKNVLTRSNIKPDLIVPCSDAANKFCKLRYADNENYIFISIEDKIWGCSDKIPFQNWGNINIEFDKNLTFEEISKCNCNNKELSEYSERLLLTIKKVINPDIMAVSTFYPSEIFVNFADKLGAELIFSEFPILNGLMELTKDKIFSSLIK